MSKSPLQTAKSLLRQRKFSFAVQLLDGVGDEYEGNFDYYLTMGIALLYQGLLGNAISCLERARKIKVADPDMMLAQAAVFLRRGDTKRAVPYYLEVLDKRPEDRTAKAALEFLRTKGDERTIMEWAENGRLEKFYPPIGFNYFFVFKIAFAAAFGAALGFLFFNLFSPKPVYYDETRRSVADLALSKDEQKNPQEKDLSGTIIHYFLNEVEITKSYEAALDYFQQGRDNMAQVEINRILNSNATFSIKQKANVLKGYLVDPGFDTLKDNFSYSEVKKNPELYLDCWVDWSGKIANMQVMEDFMRFELLVGYEKQIKLEGTVPVLIPMIPAPEIAGERPLRVLGKVGLDSGFLILNAKSVYQEIKKD